MIKWAAIFILVSLVSGLLGYDLVAGVAATVAKILLSIFAVLLVIFIFRGISGYRRISR